MTIRKFSVTVETDASGDVTAYTPYLSGYINQVQYVKDDFADGVDFTITAEDTGQAIWDEDDVNAAVIKAPRMPTCSTAGVAATFDGTYAVNDRIALARDRVKIVVASGGNTKGGTFVFVVDDGR